MNRGPTRHGSGSRKGDRPSRLPWVLGSALFLLALFLRLLYWRATPDAGWPFSAVYRGDALIWLRFAHSLQNGIPYELGLPLRPPGMGYLLSALWDGTGAGIVQLKSLWCVLGSLAVVLFYAALVRPFGLRPAFLAGLAAAASTALLMLTTSLNNETPYLVLVMASFLLLPALWDRPGLAVLGLWSAFHAWACLLRVEHGMVYAGLLLWLVVRWVRSGRPGSAGKASAVAGSAGKQPAAKSLPGKEPATSGSRRRVALAAALSLACFLLPLVPWQLRVRDAVNRFKERVVPSDEAMTPEAVRAEQFIEGMEWEPGAIREREKLPGFVRRLAADFVAATVRHRGGDTVRGEDFKILEDAFGYRPEPIPSVPFVSAYGPLNFFLANNAHATGGFNRLALDDPPPMAGGRDRYYPDPLLDPPGPGMFFLDYPPHLRAFRQGYALGWDWIREHPGDAFRLAARKIRIFWSGAALGFTGFDLPAGQSGLQRAVDLVVPRAGVRSVSWSLAVLALTVAGLWMGRSSARLVPWLLYFLSKVAIAVLFFGYARIGATAAPVVFLLGALALDRTWDRLVRSRLGRRYGQGIRRMEARPWIPALVACLLLLLIEGARFASRPDITIDGVPASAGPANPELQVDREVVIQ